MYSNFINNDKTIIIILIFPYHIPTNATVSLLLEPPNYYKDIGKIKTT
jgi:hypothetical protein